MSECFQHISFALEKKVYWSLGRLRHRRKITGAKDCQGRDFCLGWVQGVSVGTEFTKEVFLLSLLSDRNGKDSGQKLQCDGVIYCQCFCEENSENCDRVSRRRRRKTDDEEARN